MMPVVDGIEDSLIAEVQARLLAEHSDVLSDADPFRRRIRLRGAIGSMLSERQMDGARFAQILQTVSDRIVGLGRIEPLLRDPSITEIMVNGPGAVFVERGGCIEKTDIEFEDDAEVRRVIERIVAPLGLRIDGTQPWVDARLPDGARVHAILPPLSTNGPTLTVRRFSRAHPSLKALSEGGSISGEQLAILRAAVDNRRNLLVVGGTSSGKTTLLRAIAGEIPAQERIITIEDTAELALVRDHIVALESRPANFEGRGQVSLRDLVRQALRMRPDRLIVGEVRGPEVIDMMAAMNTGHEGSMATMHSNSPDEIIARIEAMAASIQLGSESLRRQIGASLDVIVGVARSKMGRRVTGIHRMVRIEDRLELEQLA